MTTAAQTIREATDKMLAECGDDQELRDDVNLAFEYVMGQLFRGRVSTSEDALTVLLAFTTGIRCGRYPGSRVTF